MSPYPTGTEADIDRPYKGQFFDRGGMVYNAMAFGAKGDGVTDDTVALQSALDTGYCFLPPGIYLITNELTLGNRRKVFGVCNSWSATGNDTVIRWGGSADANKAIIRASASVVGTEPVSALTNIHLDGLVLDGAGLVGYGLYCAYVTNDSIISNITVINTTQHGIQIEKSWYATYHNLVARNNNGNGITIGRSGWGGVNGVFLYNLRAHSCGEDKAFDRTSNPDWGYGVGFWPGAGTSLNGVVCEQNDGCGLYFSLGPSGASHVRDVYLEGNGIVANTEARSTRNYGLIVEGHANARAQKVSRVYFSGAIGVSSAQSIWLRGSNPTGVLVFEDMAFGEWVDADWGNYTYQGSIYDGLTGTGSDRINGTDPIPSPTYNQLAFSDGVAKVTAVTDGASVVGDITIDHAGSGRLTSYTKAARDIVIPSTVATTIVAVSVPFNGGTENRGYAATLKLFVGLMDYNAAGTINTRTAMTSIELSILILRGNGTSVVSVAGINAIAAHRTGPAGSLATILGAGDFSAAVAGAGDATQTVTIQLTKTGLDMFASYSAQLINSTVRTGAGMTFVA